MKAFNDTRLRIIGPLILFLMGTLFFRLNWYLELPANRLLRSDLIGLSAGYLCWNLARWVVLRLQRQFPGLDNTRRRLMWMLLLMPLLVNVAWLIRQLGHVAFNDAVRITQTLPSYTYAIGIQIFYHCIYFVIYEGDYLLWAWRRTYEQNERLKKDKLKYQLNTLKTQINPHFLFNCLNSLSMLIHDNPRQAEAFVDEISTVYRYLLRANDQELTTLGNELTFIESYFQLLKTRYGAGIELRVSVDDACLDCRMPPLTLQLLVENAVKHNVTMTRRPLKIDITSQGQSLIVANNLQRKSIAVHSTKVGLNSIATKYRLLVGSEIAIREEDTRFVVTLPLLANRVETRAAL